MTTASVSPRLLGLARYSAVALSLGTFAFLFVNDHWRLDNPFLVPDLIVCALLVVAAVAPASRAVPLLLAAFASTAGVLGVAFNSLIVAGQPGFGALSGAAVATAFAVWLSLGRAPREA